MPGIRRRVTVGHRPAIAADDVLELTRTRLASKVGLEHSHLRSGDRLRIKSGTLRDLKAITERASSAEYRDAALLDVVGRMTPVEVDRS